MATRRIGGVEPRLRSGAQTQGSAGGSRQWQQYLAAAKGGIAPWTGQQGQAGSGQRRRLSRGRGASAAQRSAADQGRQRAASTSVGRRVETGPWPAYVISH
ncbi:hypothetical protein J3E74DRAFT_290916 [Bipolaris maydis]|nr:hypothetical protein J3E74DRAFT_290916 [Bipolaris maydis]